MQEHFPPWATALVTNFPDRFTSMSACWTALVSEASRQASGSKMGTGGRLLQLAADKSSTGAPAVTGDLDGTNEALVYFPYEWDADFDGGSIFEPGRYQPGLVHLGTDRHCGCIHHGRRRVGKRCGYVGVVDLHTPWGSTCTSLNKHPLSTASSLRPSLRAGDPTPLHALPVSGAPLDIHVDPRDDAEQHLWHAYVGRMRCGVFDAALAQRRQRDVLDTASHLVSTFPPARPTASPNKAAEPVRGFPSASTSLPPSVSTPLFACAATTMPNSESSPSLHKGFIRTSVEPGSALEPKEFQAVSILVDSGRRFGRRICRAICGL
jgi:hypothetical protein